MSFAQPYYIIANKLLIFARFNVGVQGDWLIEVENDGNIMSNYLNHLLRRNPPESRIMGTKPHSHSQEVGMQACGMLACFMLS